MASKEWDLNLLIATEEDNEIAKAMDEMRAVLDKYAMIGGVVMVSVAEAAFGVSIPEWSAIKLQGKDLVVIEAAEERVKASADMLLGFRDMLNAQAKYWTNLCKGIEVERVSLESIQ